MNKKWTLFFTALFCLGIAEVSAAPKDRLDITPPTKNGGGPDGAPRSSGGGSGCTEQAIKNMHKEAKRIRGLSLHYGGEYRKCKREKSKKECKHLKDAKNKYRKQGRDLHKAALQKSKECGVHDPYLDLGWGGKLRDEADGKGMTRDQIEEKYNTGNVTKKICCAVEKSIVSMDREAKMKKEEAEKLTATIREMKAVEEPNWTQINKLRLKLRKLREDAATMNDEMLKLNSTFFSPTKGRCHTKGYPRTYAKSCGGQVPDKEAGFGGGDEKAADGKDKNAKTACVYMKVKAAANSLALSIRKICGKLLSQSGDKACVEKQGKKYCGYTNQQKAQKSWDPEEPTPSPNYENPEINGPGGINPDLR